MITHISFVIYVFHDLNIVFVHSESIESVPIKLHAYLRVGNGGPAPTFSYYLTLGYNVFS
jgi:hypothetical protein